MPDLERLPFADHVVIVTGASRENGIGAAVARRFARFGARGIVLTGRKETPRSDAVVTEVARLGSDVLYQPGDISDPQTSEEIIKATKERYGGVNVIVSNAGITRDGPVTRMSNTDWGDVLNTNLRPAFLLVRDAVEGKAFDRQNGGAVVFIGSIVGLHGNTGQENYSAAKAGLEGLTRSFAQDLGRRKIRFNTVAPGMIDTDITTGMPEDLIAMIADATPLGRIGTPEDVAKAVTDLAHPDASFITGQTLPVDGGLDGGIVAVARLYAAEYRKVQK